jgi:FixJ family two-component response regulator
MGKILAVVGEIPVGLTVFVIDGHRDARERICDVLLANGLRAEPFSTAGAFESAYDERRTGCLVLDVALPDCCGLTMQRRLSEREIAPPIIMVGSQVTVRVAVTAMKQGAVEFLEKPVCPEALLKTVRSAMALRAENQVRQARMAGAERRLRTLTCRERQVFDAIMASLGVKQVAARLGISVKTTEVHRSRVLAKMGVESVIELVSVAHLIGLFPVALKIEDMPHAGESGQSYGSDRRRQPRSRRVDTVQTEAALPYTPEGK